MAPRPAAALLLAAALAACRGDGPAPPRPVAVRTDPPAPAATAAPAWSGWRPVSLAAAGFDVGPAEAALHAVAASPGWRSVLVARHGALAAERYAGPAAAGPHDIKSAAKSILSALVGIAVEEGSIAGVDQPVVALLPRFAADRRLADITVEHLLTMTAGLASTSGAAYGAWVSSPDWTAAALSRPAAARPGERFIYSTGNTHVLSAILARVTGMATRRWAEQVLLAPLGIDVDGWIRSPEGVDMGGNGMSLTPREMLLFGQLYLQRGRWEGRQLVPAAWVERSTARHSAGWPERYGAYGYLWWLPAAVDGAAMAVGYGGQYIVVVPPRDMVVVITSSLRSKGPDGDRAVLAAVADLCAAAR